MNVTSYDRTVIVKHLKENLGHPDEGWSNEGGPDRIRVARFPDQPWEGINTFATDGLSSHLLSMGQDVGTARMEVLFAAYPRYSSEAIAGFVLSFCDFVLSKHWAFVSGEIVGPYKWPIIEGVELNAVYSAPFTYFEDNLHFCPGTSPPTVICWVLPIHAAEAAYIRKHGHEAFDNLVEANDPDLWDLNRESVV